MTKYVWANKLYTAPTTAITAADTSLTVGTVGDLVLGTGEVAMITIRSSDLSAYEIIKATSVTGNVLTIERAQEGTTAQAWGVDAVVVGGITKGQLGGFESKQAWFNTAIPAISIANGQLQELTLAANGTLSISMNNNEAMTLLIKPSSFTLTMPTIKWFGKAFVLVANKEHLLTVFKKDDVLRGTWSREV